MYFSKTLVFSLLVSTTLFGRAIVEKQLKAVDSVECAAFVAGINKVGDGEFALYDWALENEIFDPELGLYQFVDLGKGKLKVPPTRNARPEPLSKSEINAITTKLRRTSQFNMTQHHKWYGERMLEINQDLCVRRDHNTNDRGFRFRFYYEPQFHIENPQNATQIVSPLFVGVWDLRERSLSFFAVRSIKDKNGVYYYHVDKTQLPQHNQYLWTILGW